MTDTSGAAPETAPATDAPAPSIALNAALVNNETAALLADKDVAATISAPLPSDVYNPLHASPNSGPLNYYPTLESRNIVSGPATTDGNEIPSILASLPVVEIPALPVAIDSPSPQPGDSSTKDVQPAPVVDAPVVEPALPVVEPTPVIEPALPATEPTPVVEPAPATVFDVPVVPAPYAPTTDGTPSETPVAQ